VLFEGKERVLTAYPPKLSEAAKRSLEKRHVAVRVNTKVTAIDKRGVTIAHPDGTSEHVGARTVLWAAGVQGSPLAHFLGAPLDHQGRVEVRPDLSVPHHPEVFVIGDLAKMISDGKEVPGVAQGALQGGAHVAKIIRAELANRSMRTAFHYWDKGNMATIGRASAVVATGKVAISGLVAWLAWWAVHIFYLVGFKNRFLVMFHWIWSWLTFRRGARLITGDTGLLPAVTTIGPDGHVALPHGAPDVVALPPEANSSRDAALS
jgi:NADH dehydrogenase